MAINLEVRELLPPEAIVFDNPSFDNSIIGVTFGGAVIYDFDAMVAEMMKDEDISRGDAIDFIEYNTIRSLPYISDHTPIIMVAY